MVLTEVVFIFLDYALNIVGAPLVLINIGFKFDLDIPFPHGKNAVPLGLLTGLTDHHFQFNQVLLPPPARQPQPATWTEGLPGQTPPFHPMMKQ